MVRSAGVRLSDMALRASGLLRVMIATRSRITQSNSSVPVSILVSVISAPALRHCEGSKAIQSRNHPRKELDCFGAIAPRNDDQNFSTQGRNSISQLQALRGC